MYGHIFGFTWKKLNPTPIFVRLDYILISEMLFQMVLNTDIIPGYKIDHSIPYIEFAFTDIKRGPGF